MKKLFTLILAATMTLAAVAQNEYSTKTDYKNVLNLSVGGMYNYTTEDEVTYTIGIYQQDNKVMMDVVVPEYELKNTAIGTLKVGSYTIKGLIYDEEKGGYYRNYVNDGLTVSFSSTSIQEGQYALDGGTTGNNVQEILVKTNNGNITSIENKFKVGKMPFQLISTFDAKNDFVNGIKDIQTNNSSKKMYDINGTEVHNTKKGKIYIINGKKILK